MTTNVQIMKTKAEKAFAEHFDAVADRLPSGAGTLADRRLAMARFDELGLPHRRIEAWKYTDLRNALGSVDAPAVGSAPSVTAADVDAALGVLAGLDTYRAVFVNGRHDAGLSRLPSSDGVEIGPIVADADLDDVLADESIVALNTAFVTDGLAIKLADGASLDSRCQFAGLDAGLFGVVNRYRHRTPESLDIDLAAARAVGPRRRDECAGTQRRTVE